MFPKQYFLYLALMLAAFFPQTTLGQATQEKTTSDTARIISVQQLFTKGELFGHVRNFFITTFNHQELSDHYSNALGAEIGVRTAPFHGFRLGISGIFTYPVFSSRIHQRDPIANRFPATELELFDLRDPNNKSNLHRLESAYLEYSHKKLSTRIGRFSFSSPLINPQGTRMMPYMVQGLQAQVRLRKNSLMTLAWLDHFAPRSTVTWQKAENTLGLYSVGVRPDGRPSAYAQHTQTKGVAVAGLQTGAPEQVQWQTWNYWIENISNTSYTRLVLPAGKSLKFGLEGLHQFRVANGGHPHADSAYFPDKRAWAAGVMTSYSHNSWLFSVNYLHTGNSGRFTFPREWGREQFFATISRGRLEGSGKADLLVGKAYRKWSPQFTSEVALARAWLPPVQDFAHNKYGNVSYWGSIVDLNYKPQLQALAGLTFRLLYVGRISPKTDLPLARMFYNTNFHQFNFISQLTF